MGTQPMTVFAGQAVTVSIKPSVPGTVVAPYYWQGSWTAISDYIATVQSARVIFIDDYHRKQDSGKFYWVDQGPKQLNVGFYLKNACWEGPANCVGTGGATANFNVVGPTNVKVTAVTSGTFKTNVQDKDGNFINLNVTGKVKCLAGGKRVGLGEAEKRSPGIVFKATADMPPGSSGTFAWVQLINYDNVLYLGGNEKPQLERNDGLDLDPDRKSETYVYGYGDWVDDSPSMPLVEGSYTQVFRQMVATMYLMWMGDSAKGTIPVPIGQIMWETAWTVTFNPKSTDPTCKWTISGDYVKLYRFALGPQYPIWTHPSQMQTAKRIQTAK